MSTRRQFVLDERTNELLDELARDHAGNLSFVVREAIQLYAPRSGGVWTGRRRARVRCSNV